MAKITFVRKSGERVDVEAPLGYSVMEIAQLNNIDEIEGACGGAMACATCHVYVHPDWWSKVLPNGGDVTHEEHDMLDLAFDVRDMSRLSCQIVMREELDGLVVALPGATIS